MKADPERLAGFLREIARRKLRVAFEFRHESWFAEPAYLLLRKHGAALCMAESDGLSTPAVRTAPFSYFRFRKSVYSNADLEAIRGNLRRQAGSGDAFAYFKHEEEPTGALRAAAVRESLMQV